jgi:hypothetical protein
MARLRIPFDLAPRARYLAECDSDVPTFLKVP